MISEDKIYNFCKDHYYCDAEEDGGERCLWEPFENYSGNQVEEYILTDVSALQAFIKHNLDRDWDETNNKKEINNES